MVTVNEPHFEGHFPARPVMPGVLIVEAMAQTAAVLVVETLDLIDNDSLVYFMSIESAKFRSTVTPGDQLELHVEIAARPRQGLEVQRRGQGRRHARRRGRVHRDDHAARRQAAEGLSRWRSTRPPRFIRPPSSSRARRSGRACSHRPLLRDRPRGRARRRRARCTATSCVAGVTSIGEGTEIWPFASIGSAPQDLKYHGERTELIIGARNRIREYATLNPGTAGGGGVTRVGDDNLLMMSIHVGHDCLHRQRHHHGQQRHAQRPCRGRGQRDPRRPLGGAPVLPARPRRDDRRHGRRRRRRDPLRHGGGRARRISPA